MKQIMKPKRDLKWRMHYRLLTGGRPYSLGFEKITDVSNYLRKHRDIWMIKLDYNKKDAGSVWGLIALSDAGLY
jgi:hypothetical protein